ncbi:MAG: hypothetical protein LBC40_02685 [Dysgonamonadaceae bacterium]|jgi:hypothetical protein|nr:hypothetical protein [Dysgonamonadaceae bacterium]
MKKVLLFTIYIFMILISARASDNADWQEYTGRYVFSGNGQGETLEIYLQSDTILTAFSSLGEVTLTHVGKDRFEVPQYGGVIIFERDEKQQVIACRISVAAIELEELKARKQ